MQLLNKEARTGQPFLVRSAIPARRLATIVAIASVVLLVTSAVAWDGDVPEWEADVLRFFNDWPDWLEPIMWALQQVGNIMAPLAAGLIIVWFTRRPIHLIPFVLVLPLKLVFEKAIVKQLVVRERPFVSVGPEVHVRGPAVEGLSFPSGHTTTAFAMAILITAFLPRSWRPLPLLWAAVVGVARLYYGEHNVADVVAGAAMGTVFGTILWFAFLNREVANPERVESS